MHILLLECLSVCCYLIWYLQSVLVTVDHHEWYAPPQIYVRNDTTGLWIAKPAFQPHLRLESSPMTNVGEGYMNPTDVLSDDSSHLRHMHPVNNLEIIDGVVSMETNFEHGSEEARSQDRSDAGTKKRRVEDDRLTDGNVADSSFHETQETILEDATAMQTANIRDYQGGTVAVVAANASFPERIIEPTLVMFEVINSFVFLDEEMIYFKMLSIRH